MTWFLIGCAGARVPTGPFSGLAGNDESRFVTARFHARARVLVFCYSDRSESTLHERGAETFRNDVICRH